MSGNVNIGLPTDKLSFGSLEPVEPPETQTMDETYIVLVSTGSFNPPTYMHLRMFELARDALKLEGFHVIGGYMSPVNDAYKKRGLISAKHRIELCHCACRSSEFIMVDPWEANQNTFQRTLTVLCRIKSSLVESGHISGDSLKVMLVCGSDLLESFSIPGAWIREQVMTICRDFGVVCIRREGQDVDKIICNDDILSEYKVVVVPCGAFLFCFFFFLLLLICFYGASICQILAATKCLYFKVSSLMGLNQVLKFHLHG